MAMDPRQVVAMQQALMGGLGVGMPGAYGAVPQAFGGLLQPQRVPITPEQLGIPPNPPPRLPGETLFGWLGRVSRLRNPQFGQQLGPGLGNLATLPFQVDPLAAYGGQLAPQGIIGDLLRRNNAFKWARKLDWVPRRPNQLGPGLGNLATLLPFQVDPLAAAYGGQLAPQGFGGGLLQPQTTFGPNPIDPFRRFRGFRPLPIPHGLGRIVINL